MKVSKRSREKFNYFLACGLDLIGPLRAELDHLDDPDGVSALKAWHVLESTGKQLPCCEIDMLLKVLRAKATVGWQIEAWAETLYDGLLGYEELKLYCKDSPEWIIKACVAKAQKLDMQNNGFVTTRLRSLIFR